MAIAPATPTIGGVLNLKTKHATIGAFPVIGYVPDGKRIEAVLIAERTGRRLTRLGRVEFRRTRRLEPGRP